MAHRGVLLAVAAWLVASLIPGSGVSAQTNNEWQTIEPEIHVRARHALPLFRREQHGPALICLRWRRVLGQQHLRHSLPHCQRRPGSPAYRAAASSTGEPQPVPR